MAELPDGRAEMLVPTAIHGGVKIALGGTYMSKTPEEIEANAFASIRLEGGDVADADRAVILRQVRGEITGDQVREIFAANRGVLPQEGPKRSKGYVTLDFQNPTK
jgi:hypothetical protein